MLITGKVRRYHSILAVLFVIVVVLPACTTLTAVERSYIGDWYWSFKSKDGGCYSSGTLSLRQDGKYSESSEGGCELILASDGFGIYQWGWYIVGDRLCFERDKNSRFERKLTDECIRNGYKIATNNKAPVLLKPAVFIKGADFIELKRTK